MILNIDDRLVGWLKKLTEKHLMRKEEEYIVTYATLSTQY